MRVSTDIAFKEWAVVVDALGRGEQVVILRKGGIRETRGQFQVDHREFWLFPTQYHEADQAIIASKQAALRELAARSVPDAVEIEFLAVADPVLRIDDPELLNRLQGCHIWREPVLQQRFQFGREPGLHALVTRVYRLPAPQRFALRDGYGGCKSWVQLDRPITADALTPVLSDAAFNQHRQTILERLAPHACTHS